MRHNPNRLAAYCEVRGVQLLVDLNRPKPVMTAEKQIEIVQSLLDEIKRLNDVIDAK